MNERHTTRRNFLRTATAAAAAGLAWHGGIARARAAKNELVFVGFGGSYQEGQTKALFEPFEKETGINLELHLLGRLLADCELVTLLAVRDDRVVHLVASTRIRSETTIPPSEITATSLVPPPMSRMIDPVGLGRRAGPPRSRPPSAPRSGRPGARRPTGTPPPPPASRPR